MAAYVKEDVHHMKTSMINGYDTDQTMLRIGAMNLLLHDVTAPQLAWRDSLSAQNEDQSCYFRSSWRIHPLQAVSTRIM